MASYNYVPVMSTPPVPQKANQQQSAVRYAQPAAVVNTHPAKPLAPQFTIMTPQGANMLARVQLLSVSVQCHISTAFVTIEGIWINHVADKATALLQLPTNHHVTVTSVDMTVGGRIFETLVVSPKDAHGYVKNGDSDAVGQNYNPELFVLPVNNVALNSELRVKITYFQQLEYIQGEYHFKLPMVLAPESFPPGARPESIVRLNVEINAGTPYCKWGSASHPLLSVQENYGGYIRLAGNNQVSWQNVDFAITYHVLCSEILASLLVTGPIPGSYDPRGSFALFVSPPPPGTRASFGRSIYFILDRSGSMTGQPMEDAKRSLMHGLSLLQPNDRFNIIAFDDHQEFFSATLVDASPYNIENARRWTSDIQSRGLTDILTPMQMALKELEADANIPFVFLLTDGAVDNERKICQVAQSSAIRTRICTFGIGTYCNDYFLQMLARIGRGFHDLALNPDSMYQQISHMLERASLPILTDITVAIGSVTNVELYPFPIPDLFVGAPLVICGKFSGQFPSQVILQGRHCTGETFQLPVNATVSPVDIDKIFIKQRLDMLTAQAWFEENDKMVQQIIDLSVATGMPCAHTVMVAYETTPQKKAEYSQKEGKNAGDRPSMSNKKKLALLAGAGGGIALGVAIMSFGSVGATFANASSLAAMTGLFDAGFGDLFGGLGDALGGAAGAVGDAAGGVANAVGDMASGDCGCCEMDMSCCDSIGDMFSSMDCSGCGDCGDCDVSLDGGDCHIM